MRQIMCLCVLAIGCSVSSESDARSLRGVWTITEAIAAPWGSGQVANRDFLSQRVEFGASEVIAPGVLNCNRVRYAEISTPRAGLFMGRLPAPEDASAKRLGLTQAAYDSVALSCSTGVFMFHFSSSNTLKFALDSTIYTLQRG